MSVLNTFAIQMFKLPPTPPTQILLSLPHQPHFRPFPYLKIKFLKLLNVLLLGMFAPSNLNWSGVSSRTTPNAIFVAAHQIAEQVSPSLDQSSVEVMR